MFTPRAIKTGNNENSGDRLKLILFTKTGLSRSQYKTFKFLLVLSISIDVSCKALVR